MSARTITVAILSAIILVSPVAAKAYENEASPAGQKTEVMNRGHVGIHQRQEAIRHEMGGSDSTAASVSKVAPAAGGSEKTEKTMRNCSSQGKKTGGYNE